MSKSKTLRSIEHIIKNVRCKLQ